LRLLVKTKALMPQCYHNSPSPIIEDFDGLANCVSSLKSVPV
jgi:hypothetical protein